MLSPTGDADPDVGWVENRLEIEPIVEIIEVARSQARGIGGTQR